ncbi:MAG: cytochrome c553 [Rhodobacteraceae bacterium HLUCCA08]|nr:MAG: cytochrome c553 [Rhodobacteraceae bacterium HLUCCA08]
MPRAAAILLACLVPAAGLTDTPLVEAGRTIFVETCASCHGETGQSVSIGDIRGTRLSTLRRVPNGFEQMPPIALTEDEIAAIAAYLAALAAADP